MMFGKQDRERVSLVEQEVARLSAGMESMRRSNEEIALQVRELLRLSTQRPPFQWGALVSAVVAAGSFVALSILPIKENVAKLTDAFQLTSTREIDSLRAQRDRDEQVLSRLGLLQGGIEQIANQGTEYRTENNRRVERLELSQASQGERTSSIEGRLAEIAEQVHQIDNNGSRVWNKEELDP